MQLRLAPVLVVALRLGFATSSFPPLPTITPTIFDPDAPTTDACPGYVASNVVETNRSLTAELSIAGPECNVFGTDIPDLHLTVTYQAKDRLNIRIEPKYITPENRSRFILGTEYVRLPEWDGEATTTSSDLQFQWQNSPTFRLSILRRHNGEVLFSTSSHALVFEDQFLEMTTDMVPDYNVYGLAENIRNFRLGNNYTQTVYTIDSEDKMDENGYGSHPILQETRYWEGKPSTAHGMYARNAHAQEWLMREKALTFRAIGGIFDFYFLSGQSGAVNSGHDSSSSALEVIRQYQRGCAGLPAMQQYWTMGFHQCHWGWPSIKELREVVANYSNAGIPLESIWNDIDLYDRTRIFTNDVYRYPSKGMYEFVEFLHSRGQRYVAIQDGNVYFPDPSNETDIAVYPAYARGADVNAYVRDVETGYFYIGEDWPGDSVWVDWLNPAGYDWWVEEVARFHDLIPFDGLWVDLNEPSSACTFPCGNRHLKIPPSQLPGGVAHVSLSDPRNLDFPPYKINNARPSKHAIENTIAFSAFHNDEYNTREYDAHQLFSIGILKGTYDGIKAALPEKRPFILTRSTFIGAGQYSAHWGGDNKARWGAMYLSISQSFGFQMAGIPMFGVDTCGFSRDSNEELCARWMELSAFFPFYRNHYEKGKRAQEAYLWPVVAEASRRAIGIRYSILPYLYTLFYNAHIRGDTVMRALAWEFPDDFSLRETDNQFLLGPSILVTPVLEPKATTVKGVFPGIGEGTRWYDWYTRREVKGVAPGENVTMAAPLEHINLHIRGGSIITTQLPGNTTAETKANPYSLLVAVDQKGSATGSLYLDDGESIVQDETRHVEFSFADGELRVRSWGQYPSGPALSTITILGLEEEPVEIVLEIVLRIGEHSSRIHVMYANSTLEITDLEGHTTAGAWEQDMTLVLNRILPDTV